MLTLAFASVQGAVAIGAYLMTMEEAIVDSVLKIAGFAIGLLLGLYGLGLIAPRASERVALVAFAVGTAVTTFVAFRTPNASKFNGESCGGVNFIITDWNNFRSLDLGLVVAHALRSLYPDDWKTKDYIKLLANKSVFDQMMAGNDVASILKSYEADLREFRERRKPFELYQ